jgi:Uma2 family endonuclease
VRGASPSTARTDFSRKLPIYAREKVAHAWVINPAFRTLEVFRLQDGGWFLAGAYSGDDKVRAEPFDAIELELGALWLPED